LLLNIRI